MRRLLLVIMAVPFIAASCGHGNVGYSGRDISDKLTITRDSESKAARVAIELEGDWKIFAGPTVESIEMGKPVLEGRGEGVYSLPVGTGRSYFEVVSGKDRGIFAERHLPMEGGYNFRDLGGYRTAEGRYVKWGKIFRSDDLYNLSGSDLAYLASIPVISVVDFRAPAEIEAAPDRLPQTAVSYELSISPGNLSAVAKDLEAFGADQMEEAMMEMNRMMVTQPEFVEQYRRFFALLQDDNNVPLMFHCSAGKDRTGMGAALVLWALGVDEETIMEDYLSSNVYLGDKYAPMVKANPNLEPLMTVKAEYLSAGLEQICKDHGSVEKFLTGELGVDIEKFRGMYLY